MRGFGVEDDTHDNAVRAGHELDFGLAIAERVFDPLVLPVPARGEVGFDRVSFAYPVRSDVKVLDAVSFTVRPGEKVAIVGPSGAGKSTIFHLLLRFYDPRSGTISLDGVPVRSADPGDFRARVEPYGRLGWMGARA